MARIGDFYSWASDQASVRLYVGLGVDTSEDVNLELWYSAAIAMAERRVNRDFNDGADPPVGVDPPDDATLALLEGVKAMRNLHRRNYGVLSITTASLSESYGEASVRATIMGAMSSILAGLRLNAHLEGAGAGA